MYRLIAGLVALGMLAAGPGLGQEQTGVEASSETEQSETAAEAAAANSAVFTPSEEVEADTAVAFPTDI